MTIYTMKLCIEGKYEDVSCWDTICRFIKSLGWNLDEFQCNDQPLYRLAVDEETKSKIFYQYVPTAGFNLGTKQLDIEYNKVSLDYNDGPTLFDLGLCDGDVINHRCSIVNVKIFGKISVILIHDSNTVLQLMLKIQVRESIPFQQQRLILVGRELDPNKTLADYNTQIHEMLHLVVKPQITLYAPKVHDISIMQTENKCCTCTGKSIIQLNPCSHKLCQTCFQQLLSNIKQGCHVCYIPIEGTSILCN